MAEEKNRPNFFELLELDPNAVWNQEEFQKRLSVKRAEWTSRVRNPKHATRYNFYLELISKITETMSDSTLRQAEAERARQEFTQKQAHKRQEFEQDMELLAAKGFVTEGDIKALVGVYAGVVSELDIRTQLRRRDLPMRTLESSDGGGALDAATMKSMQAQLELLEKQDLYDLLGLPRSAASFELLKAANGMYDDTQRKASKTADVTAKSVLAGHAMALFKDERERRKYDAALAELAYERVLDAPLVRLLQGPDKTLYAGQYQRLLEQARAQHLDVDRAAAYIRERARKLGAAIEVSDISLIKAQRVCPYCDTMSSPETKICPTCGVALEMPCPGCGREILSELVVCSFCAFPVGDIFIIRHQLSDTIDLLRAQRYDLAAEKFQHVWFLWGRLPNRQYQNDLLAELEWQFNEVDQELEWQRGQLASLHQYIDRKAFYGARDLLRQLEADWGSGAIASERQSILTAIQTAEEGLQRARALEGDAAVQVYLDILAACSDCREAQAELARIPPAPPSQLAVRQGNDLVSLEWQASPSKGVRYLVQRKSQSRPISAQDGLRLAEVNASRFDDTALEIGLPLYYAVYAERGGVVSLEAAASSVPLLLMRPVSTLTATVDNGTVHLGWEPAPNMESAIVIRAEGHYPRHREDGEAVRVLDVGYTADKGLVNGKTYYYSVFSTFLDQRGEMVEGPAAYITATPQEAPDFIDTLDFKVLQTGKVHELDLTWASPKKGEVVILQSSQRPPFKERQILPESALSGQGELLVGVENRVKASVEAARIVYFTPVVLFEKMAYIGKIHDYASLEDVKNLRVQHLGTELQLRWEWPPNCRKVVVSYRYLDEGSSASAVRTELTKAQYNLRGYYAIVEPAQRDMQVVVYALIDQDGAELMASGRTAQVTVHLGGNLVLQYALKQARKLFGQAVWYLELRVEGKGRLPDLVLLQKQGTLPSHATDGEVLLRVEGGHLKTGRQQISLPVPASGRGYGRLFLVNEGDYESRGGHVRIIHPVQEKLRLF